jgi:hypothetical protein
MDETNDDWNPQPGSARERSAMSRIGRPTALVAGGLIAGAAIAGTMTAGAADLTGSSSEATAGQYGPPGAQENDGAPGSQEARAAALGLSGTVTAVGADTVSIKTSAGATTVYKVDNTSDIDKNGEATLGDLVAGDAVRYSVRPGTTTIDKLHAGDESKDLPSGPPGGSRGSTGSSSGEIGGNPGSSA